MQNSTLQTECYKIKRYSRPVINIPLPGMTLSAWMKNSWLKCLYIPVSSSLLLLLQPMWEVMNSFGSLICGLLVVYLEEWNHFNPKLEAIESQVYWNLIFIDSFVWDRFSKEKQISIHLVLTASAYCFGKTISLLQMFVSGTAQKVTRKQIRLLFHLSSPVNLLQQCFTWTARPWFSKLSSCCCETTKPYCTFYISEHTTYVRFAWQLSCLTGACSVMRAFWESTFKTGNV